MLSRTSNHKTIHTNHEIQWFYDVISQKENCWIFREPMGFRSSRFAEEYRTSRCGQRLKFERWNRTVALTKSREPKWSFVGEGSTRIKTGRHVFFNECYMMMYTMFIFVHISKIYIYTYTYILSFLGSYNIFFVVIHKLFWMKVQECRMMLSAHIQVVTGNCWSF